MPPEDEIPSITVVIGDSGDSISTSNNQGPLIVSEPLIIKRPTVEDVLPVPVDGSSVPLAHLSVLRTGDAPIAKHRAVTQLADGKIVHVNPASEDHREAYLGITANSASPGRKATVITQGIMTSTAWLWSPGPVHCTVDGVLTQVATADTFPVATALTPTQIEVGVATVVTTGHATTFIYNAPTAMAQWVIVHGMGRYPAVTVVDSDNNQIYADVDHVDINTVHVNFAFATGGSAYLV